MNDQDRRMKLHEAICRCATCKGTTDKNKLCPSCKLLEDLIDQLPAPAAAMEAA